MATSRRPGIWLAAILPVILFDASGARADKLQITSRPSGATVTIDGVMVGTTPYETTVPGGYLRKTKTSVGARLEHAMTARISHTGYAAREIQMTEGPINWVSLKGHNHGSYWLLKTDHFHVELQPASQAFTGSVVEGAGQKELEPELSLEELVKRAKPAVVYLKSRSKSGTGFFVTETGVMATNAHLARGEEELLAVLPDGTESEAQVVYVDPELDIALAKVAGGRFPHLTLLPTSMVRQGETVVAVGNPGDAMLFSVTKGIVSAVGRVDSAGPGTWIQTDAPINPGNSGGPLLNRRGEVIGINSQKLIKKNVSGISFALSASDLLAVLHRFYPMTAQDKPEHVATGAWPTGASLLDAAAPIERRAAYGSLEVHSEPDGAEIFLDGQFVGSSPAKFRISAGDHTLVFKLAGRKDWSRSIHMVQDSSETVRAEMEP